MESLMLDGNAIAGLLQELFAVEMTSAVETCATCGRAEAIGAAHVYRGAGVVVRCPHCGSTLAKIVRMERRAWLDLRGVKSIELEV